MHYRCPLFVKEIKLDKENDEIILLLQEPGAHNTESDVVESLKKIGFFSEPRMQLVRKEDRRVDVKARLKEIMKVVSW